MGTLKSYSKMQGYGFITSEDVNDQNPSCDVYLDRSQLLEGRWQIGQALEFEMTYNHRGQPQARNVNWDPVPKLPMEAPNAGGAGGLGAGAPTPGVNLMALAGARMEGQQGLRILSKLQNHLRSDKGQAVREAIELQENSESTDYISFVLDRLGDPQTAIKEDLKSNIPALLLLAITKMLRKSPQMAPDRAARVLAWAEALVPLLSSASNANDSNEDVKFEAVLSSSLENLQGARSAAPSPLAYDATIAQLVQATKALQGN
jgi:cold shock CspA family protein